MRRLANLLGMRLALRSRPGRGSSFTLRMDALADAAAAEPATPAAVSAAPADAVADASAGLVLGVDDDADIRVGMRALLAGWGHAVIDAGGIADLLPQLRGVWRVPCLVNSDHRLRGDETGHKVVARLRHEYNDDIPAIMITSDTAPERLREAATGDHTLLHKPVQPQQLREAMHAVMAAAAAPTGG